MSLQDESSEDWAGLLAQSLVARSPLPAPAAQALKATFWGNEGGATELRLVLASGEGELESFLLLRNGEPPPEGTPLTPEPFCSLTEPSAAREALQQSQLVTVDAQTPGRDVLADWRQLHAGAGGVGWLLAAPLCPAGTTSRRLREPCSSLGAVLAGGRGPVPTVDAAWLQGWAAEMGCLIRHASVQLMESSLELLGVIFPPPVLEQLVANAAKKSGQVDLADVLRGQGPTQGGPPSPPAPSPAKRPAPRDSRPLALPAGIPVRLRGDSLAGMAAAGRIGLTLAPAMPSDGDTVAPSPFAAAAAAAAAADTASSSMAGTGHATPSRAPALAPAAAALLHRASRANSAGGAAALLRHVSASFDPLGQGSGEVPLTPHTLGDISGFEDLLEQDHRCSLERRPSRAPERARSHPAAALDQCFAAAAASLDEAAAGGPPAATQAHVAGQAAGGAAAAGQAAAAAGQVPAPAVRVPWQTKPLAHALSTGADPSPIGSPQKPAPQAAPAASSSWGSGFVSGVSSLGSGSLGSPPAGPAAPPSGNKDASAGGSGQKQAGCAGGAGGSLLAARPVKAAGQQRWDLSFCSASLEAQFRRWAAPYWVRTDASLGLVHWLVLATAIAKLVQQGPSGGGAALSLAGLLAMASTALPACLAPVWWAGHRTSVLAGVRLLVALLFAAQALAAAQAAGPAPPVERALVSSGAAALAFLPIRFPLPFAIHLPLHLLCLWALTAACSVAHLAGAGPAAAAGALLAQLLVGFLLSTLLAYRREQRLRSSFLQKRATAGCLGSPRVKSAPPAVPSGPLACGSNKRC